MQYTQCFIFMLIAVDLALLLHNGIREWKTTLLYHYNVTHCLCYNGMCMNTFFRVYMYPTPWFINERQLGLQRQGSLDLYLVYLKVLKENRAATEIPCFKRAVTHYAIGSLKYIY